MDSLQIILDNEVATNNSFLYYLHEINRFDVEQFDVLCKAISDITTDFDIKENKAIAYKVHFIYTQIIYHILYHFNPNDLSCIENLPADFPEHLDKLDVLVHNFLYHKL